MRVLIAAGGTAGHINRLWPSREPSKRPTRPPRYTLQAGRRGWNTVS